MRYNLIVDDERTIEHIVNYKNQNFYYDYEWVIVRNYTDFCEFVKSNGLPDIVSFDHDIASFIEGEEKTGKDCAMFLIDYCIDNDLDFPTYFIHSANPVGESNIKGLIDNFINLRSKGFFN